MQDGGRPSRFAFQRPRQSGSEFIWGWPPFAGVRTALRRRGEEQECCAPPGARGWLLSDCCFHTRTAWKSARTGFICLFILLVLLKLRYTFYVYGKSKNSSQQLLKKKKAQRGSTVLRVCVRMWSPQPLVKFRCPVKNVEGIFMTSLCIRGLYFMRDLCFLGVTITFSFILG